ncbi:hypothetical protein GCM10022243_55160 [Saccharothrix violaceirubra]
MNVRTSSVSTRNATVLTKNPTNRSSAASPRPATGVPIVMSRPAPTRRSNAVRQACSTMNTLTPVSAANRRTACAVPGGTVNGTVSPAVPATAGRGRSAGSSSTSGTPARAVRQCASCASPDTSSRSRCHSA